MDRGRPKKILRETIKKDLALNGFTENLTFNIVQGYKLILVLIVDLPNIIRLTIVVDICNATYRSLPIGVKKKKI